MSHSRFQEGFVCSLSTNELQFIKEKILRLRGMLEKNLFRGSSRVERVRSITSRSTCTSRNDIRLLQVVLQRHG